MCRYVALRYALLCYNLFDRLVCSNCVDVCQCIDIMFMKRDLSEF